MSFDRESIAAAISTRFIGRHLVFLPTIGSTQDVAKDLARQGAPTGALVVAEEQTAGRGRLDRRWLAPAGSSLLMSLLLRPRLDPDRLHRLTMVCSLGIVDGVRETTGLAVGIKWPNDIVTLPDASGRLVSSRKLGGLLTEADFRGEALDYAVVGMGLNVNLDIKTLPQTITPATSIASELGRPVDRLPLLCSILRHLESWYLTLNDMPSGSEAGPDSVLAAWLSRLVTIGQQVHVNAQQDQVDGRAESVDVTGALLVRTADGELKRIMVGDVSSREHSVSLQL